MGASDFTAQEAGELPLVLQRFEAFQHSHLRQARTRQGRAGKDTPCDLCQPLLFAGKVFVFALVLFAVQEVC